MKKILHVQNAPGQHWVGNGFPVHSLFGYDQRDVSLDPFLLLDYAPPTRFGPVSAPRGVGKHPHRGFETVTIVYAGELEHRDSAGGGGTIGPGDVQWMTAGGGIVHEEFHSRAFTEQGGELEMAQLWVNLPARDKAAQPRYQALRETDIPAVELPDEAGRVRVVAGAFGGHDGPAETFSPVDVWDVRMNAGKRATFSVPDGHGLVVVALDGTVLVNGEEILRAVQLAALDRAGSEFTLEANSDAKLLVLSGEPLDEPVVGHGPFVMNSQAEIRQAIDDFNSGRFGAP